MSQAVKASWPKVFVAAALILGAYPTLICSQQLEQPIAVLGVSRVAYPDTPQRKGFVLDVHHDDECKEYFKDDCFELTLSRGKGSTEQVLGTKKFESSYGYFDLRFSDLTGDGIEELVLVTGKGHGTQARINTLEVWRLTNGSFETILSVPASGNWGIGRHWWYETEFADVDGNRIPDLRLVLKVDPVPEADDDTSGIPTAKVLEYTFDSKARAMVPRKTAAKAKKK